jgi:large subunit ribosomal protein L15
MPPRVPLRPAAHCCRGATGLISRAIELPSLFVALSLQTRHASILANLRDNPGAHQKRIRVGRGPSSGYGKTSGRGHKGQKQHGKVKPWFQGGQTSLMKVWGKKGFINQYVLSVLAHWANWRSGQRRSPLQQTITPAEANTDRFAVARPRLRRSTSTSSNNGSTAAESTPTSRSR